MIKNVSFEFKADGKNICFAKLPFEEGIYSCKEYKLELTMGDHLSFVFHRIDGKDFCLDSVCYSFGFALHNPAKIIVPDTGRHFMDTFYPRQVMAKARFLSSAAKMASPFMAFLDSTEQVKIAFALTGKMMDTEFLLESPGANSKYSLVVKSQQWKWKITKPFDEKISLGKMKSYKDGFFVSTGDKSWFHALKKYSKIYRRENNIKLQTNINTYDAEFCTWRVINSDKFTHKWTIETARECKKIGIDAMILDDGWFGVGLDSEIMESSLGNWPRKIEGKYEDITKTIEKIKKEGVKPLLWFCPLGLGPQSDNFEKLQKFCVENNGKPYVTPGLFRTLCPRNPQARTIMVQMLRKLLNYNPDGFKPDLFNYQPIEACTADHEHDIPTTLEALKECMRLMYEEAVNYNPEMIFMLKNDEANVEFSQFAPAVRSGDSPYDPNIMLLRCAYANAIAPLVINDYLMVGKEESLKDIAYCLIKQIAMGVPAVSIDLLNAPYEQRALLKNWIGFYNSTAKAIHMNSSPEPQDSSLFCWQSIDRTNSKAMFTVIHPCNTIYTLEDADEIYILNASQYEKIFIGNNQLTGKMKSTSFDYMHKETCKNTITPDNDYIKVPTAGMCILAKK